MSNKLPVITIGKNEQITTTSLNVAEVFGKRHDHVLRDIDNLLSSLPSEWGVPNFGEGSKTNTQNGQSYRYFNLTRDGFMLLVMGFTGEKALKLKLAYIEQFNAMETALHALHYRKHDKKAQIEAMAVIGHLLPPEEAKDALNYIKANTVVNKIVSSIHGFPKMLKKDEMNLDMLKTRSNVLDKYVKLFELGFTNSEIKNILNSKLLAA
jgi:Rha family phage regulatory protein